MLKRPRELFCFLRAGHIGFKNVMDVLQIHFCNFFVYIQCFGIHFLLLGNSCKQEPGSYAFREVSSGLAQVLSRVGRFIFSQINFRHFTTEMSHNQTHFLVRYGFKFLRLLQGFLPVFFLLVNIQEMA